MATADCEEVMNYLETHDVGEGAMLKIFTTRADIVGVFFACRCGDEDGTHCIVRGKKLDKNSCCLGPQLFLPYLAERLFLAGWNALSEHKLYEFTWTKTNTYTPEAEC